MAKKQTRINNKTKIRDAYIDYVLTHGKVPGNVYLFCKDIEIKEDVFYKYYGTFEAIDTEIFQSFFDNTVKVLDKSEDFKSFDSRNRLLSFYYTYFEVLKVNRSFVTQILSHKKDVLKSMSVLSGLKHRFQEYLDEIGVESQSLKIEKLDELRLKGTKEFFWGQFLMIIKFWLDDGSAGFEKTDVFIEKSVTASFDLMDTTPLKSVLDLAKFVYKEKLNPVS